MPATLGYWKLRGLGQSIRFLLEYTGTDYKERLYEFGPPPAYDCSQWEVEKFELGMDFPNLPYYFDGNLKITQSNAIMRYIARQHGLAGNSEEEIVLVDVLENFAMDMRIQYVRLVYDGEFENLKDKYIKENLPKNFDLLSKFLGDKKWLVGEKITFVDFLVYELLDINQILAPDCLKAYPNLQSYMSRFESLAPIKAFMKSPKFLRSPLNGPRALFGGH